MPATATYPPSHVHIKTVPPLVGKLGKAENEAAAAILLDVMATSGDKWRAVTPGQIADFLDGAIRTREPWKSLGSNPFFNPNWFRLVADGYAEFEGRNETLNTWRSVAFTQKGIDALRPIQ